MKCWKCLTHPSAKSHVTVLPYPPQYLCESLALCNAPLDTCAPLCCFYFSIMPHCHCLRYSPVKAHRHVQICRDTSAASKTCFVLRSPPLSETTTSETHTGHDNHEKTMFLDKTRAHLWIEAPNWLLSTSCQPSWVRQRRNPLSTRATDIDTMQC